MNDFFEIADAPGEIFDIPEMQELDSDDKFDVNEYLNANYDYWWWTDSKCWLLVNNSWRTLMGFVMSSFANISPIHKNNLMT